MSVSNDKLHISNSQSACPLFTRIPPEVRNQIFHLALTEYDDTTKPYDQSSFYYRPGYHFSQRLQTGLLRTCRRIYHEAHLLPVAINEHVFWCYRQPPGRRNASDPDRYFKKMTPQQQDAVDTVHFFTQQFWLEGDWAATCRISEMRPRKVKITIRHSDWWCWESEEKLGIDPRLPGRVDWDQMGNEPVRDEFERAWGYQFRHLHGLRELEMELETIASNKDQLDAIAQRALDWKFDLSDGNVLSAQGTEMAKYTWKGRKGRTSIENIGWYAGRGLDELASNYSESEERYSVTDYLDDEMDYQDDLANLDEENEEDEEDEEEMTEGRHPNGALNAHDLGSRNDPDRLDEEANLANMDDWAAEHVAAFENDQDPQTTNEGNAVTSVLDTQDGVALADPHAATEEEDLEVASADELSYYVLKLTLRARAPATEKK